MNKIYKVVWSKVKNCYVVVSEIAKNVISGSVKSAKVGTAPLVKGAALGAMMAFVITGNVWAGTISNNGTPISESDLDKTLSKGEFAILHTAGTLTIDGCEITGISKKLSYPNRSLCACILVK